ncbi:sulfurtransferase [Flavobacterium selenitireducens]|uniref:sulfurtransferase n=1 Tax=Flavobacterium selenitireducens TaxID=2722704 RepID=UPI00168AA422|nr:sulfurtransferase [Flavobacterium selenitireducens]MBD3581076.1 sulfurtransferase [Flavobacterium selenitireducens]
MSHLVSVGWLYENRADKRMVVLDASLAHPQKSGTHCIPESRFFDLENTFSDKLSDLPNTMVAKDTFTIGTRKLGISTSSVIVVYDNKGIYSSPRVWWMFRSMGHQNVFVLDGGLPEWKRKGFAVSDKHSNPEFEGDFVPTPVEGMFCNGLAVLSAMSSSIIVDVRSRERFAGLVEETREGLRKGHIPSSVNLPFEHFIVDGKLRAMAQIRSLFGAEEHDSLIFSCGSGVTACIGALAAAEAGFKNVAVYDGSWSEWGKDSEDFPIA